MGLFNRFFNTKRKNIIEEIIAILIKEEKKNPLLKKSPFLKNKQFDLSEEGIISFVIAELCFQMDTNPKFQSLKFKKEYSDIIENQKNKQAFNLLCSSMHKYYNGDPNLDKALYNITYAYLESVWMLTEIIPDAVMLTSYNMVISNMRLRIKNYFTEILSELTEK